MSIIKHTFNFAADYNCGVYGAGTYQNSTCGAESPSGGGLADTGYDILLPVFLGISLVVASAVLLTKRWLRKRRQNAATSPAN
jgi:hypothetical protein